MRSVKKTFTQNMDDRNPWWSTRFTPLPKIIIDRLSKMPHIFLESLELNSIAPITTQSSGPYEFAYKAKRSTLDTVSCLAHLILTP